MNKWNYEKLEEMTNTDNDYIEMKLNYTYIANNYEDILIKTYADGNITPTLFNDVELAYEGKILNDIQLPQITDELKNSIDEKRRARKVVELKHFSRDMTHKDWFKHLEDEVREFIEKYPEFKDVIF
ncbi:MAG: hypothetical protein BZ137_01895 [Methanosphaera sp. rholeuAM130]|nr:MAG: hypothetical protein BZ137_01895 [Methanosphaera sp. rholeuAM130]